MDSHIRAWLVLLFGFCWQQPLSCLDLTQYIDTLSKRMSLYVPEAWVQGMPLAMMDESQYLRCEGLVLSRRLAGI